MEETQFRRNCLKRRRLMSTVTSELPEDLQTMREGPEGFGRMMSLQRLRNMCENNENDGDIENESNQDTESMNGSRVGLKSKDGSMAGCYGSDQEQGVDNKEDDEDAMERESTEEETDRDEEGGEKEEEEEDDDEEEEKEEEEGTDTDEEKTDDDVLIVGLGPVGSEIARNLVLSGIGSITLMDWTSDSSVEDNQVPGQNKNVDITGQNLPSTSCEAPNDLECLMKNARWISNRATICASRISKLMTNPDVAVQICTGEIDFGIDDLSFIYRYSCVVFADRLVSLNQMVVANDCCRRRSPPVRFIIADVCGVSGWCFIDFGEDFKCSRRPLPPSQSHSNDQIETDAVQSSGCQPPTASENSKRIGLGRENTVVDVDGKQSSGDGGGGINASHVNVIGGVTAGRDRDGGGTDDAGCEGGSVDVVHRTVVSFDMLGEQLHRPSLQCTDPLKMSTCQRSFLAMIALDTFFWKYGRDPYGWIQEDAEELITMAQTHNRQYHVFDDKIFNDDKSLLQLFYSAGLESFPAVCSVIGGVAANEVINCLTESYEPIRQWFFFDACEMLPQPDPLASLDWPYNEHLTALPEDLDGAAEKIAKNMEKERKDRKTRKEEDKEERFGEEDEENYVIRRIAQAEFSAVGTGNLLRSYFGETISQKLAKHIILLNGGNELELCSELFRACSLLGIGVKELDGKLIVIANPDSTKEDEEEDEDEDEEDEEDEDEDENEDEEEEEDEDEDEDEEKDEEEDEEEEDEEDEDEDEEDEEEEEESEEEEGKKSTRVRIRKAYSNAFATTAQVVENRLHVIRNSDPLSDTNEHSENTEYSEKTFFSDLDLAVFMNTSSQNTKDFLAHRRIPVIESSASSGVVRVHVNIPSRLSEESSCVTCLLNGGNGRMCSARKSSEMPHDAAEIVESVDWARRLVDAMTLPPTALQNDVALMKFVAMTTPNWYFLSPVAAHSASSPDSLYPLARDLKADLEGVDVAMTTCDDCLCLARCDFDLLFRSDVISPIQFDANCPLHAYFLQACALNYAVIFREMKIFDEMMTAWNLPVRSETQRRDAFIQSAACLYVSSRYCQHSVDGKRIMETLCSIAKSKTNPHGLNDNTCVLNHLPSATAVIAGLTAIEVVKLARAKYESSAGTHGRYPIEYLHNYNVDLLSSFKIKTIPLEIIVKVKDPALLTVQQFLDRVIDECYHVTSFRSGLNSHSTPSNYTTSTNHTSFNNHVTPNNCTLLDNVNNCATSNQHAMSNNQQTPSNSQTISTDHANLSSHANNHPESNTHFSVSNNKRPKYDLNSNVLQLCSMSAHRDMNPGNAAIRRLEAQERKMRGTHLHDNLLHQLQQQRVRDYTQHIVQPDHMRTSTSRPLPCSVIGGSGPGSMPSSVSLCDQVRSKITLHTDQGHTVGTSLMATPNLPGQGMGASRVINSEPEQKQGGIAASARTVIGSGAGVSISDVTTHHQRPGYRSSIVIYQGDRLLYKAEKSYNNDANSADLKKKLNGLIDVSEDVTDGYGSYIHLRILFDCTAENRIDSVEPDDFPIVRYYYK